jgi:hypothetical protein
MELSPAALAELEVLSCIFDSDTFAPSPETASCRFNAVVDVAEAGLSLVVPARAIRTDSSSVPPPLIGLFKRGSSCGDPSATLRDRLVVLAQLAPIELTVALPPGYPLSEAPVALLRAPWLSIAASRALSAALLSQWCVGETCLFQWLSWLRSDAVTFLLADTSGEVATDLPLDSTFVRLHHHASETDVRLPREFSPADAISDMLSGTLRGPATIRCLILTALEPASESQGVFASAASSDAESSRLSAMVALASAIDDLLLYDLSARRQRWSDCVFSCPVCLEDVPGRSCLALSSCGHAFCRSCLHQHVRGCMQNGLQVFTSEVARSTEASPSGRFVGIACPDIACKALVAHHDVRSVLIPEFSEDFARSVVESWVGFAL